MTTQHRRPTISAFESREHAERAVGGLRDAGFRDEEIGWAMRHEEAPAGTHDVSDEVAKDATAGAVTGGVMGGLGAAAAMALIPGIGPFLAGGALGTVLITAGASAAAGGLLGGLIGMGASEDEAKFYDEEFRSGRPVMTVDAGDRSDQVRDIFRKSGGYDYESRRMAGSQTSTTPTSRDMGTTTTNERIVVTADDTDRDVDRPVSGEQTTEYTRTTTRTDR